jgi:hypothetical protein
MIFPAKAGLPGNCLPLGSTPAFPSENSWRKRKKPYESLGFPLAHAGF